MVTLETKQGKVTGKVLSVRAELSENKCVNFNSIPFANTQKFERPQPYGKWEGTLDGTGPTPRQVQNNMLVNEYDKLLGVTLFPEGGEKYHTECPEVDDTLYLSVYTPENFESTKKKPVMVWIHGGGLTIGGAYEYFGTMLSIFGDVVVVPISYRLNALGFAFGNWGFWDQVEALKWVQNNIAEFGGDKDNVTIFGESAGSWSVEAMLLSEKASGLFHKAIGQSGCTKCMYVESDQQYEGLLGWTKKHLKVETEDEIKRAICAMSNEELVTFYKAIPLMLGGFTSRTDTDDFFPDTFKKLNNFVNKVPFITGMNSTESGCLLLLFADFMTPGLSDGWTEEQMIDNYKKGTEAMGKDPEIIPEFVNQLKKTYSAGRDMSGKMEYSRLHALSSGDQVFLGCLDRVETVCNDQPTFHYNLDVQTKAFHEEPYRNGAEKGRYDFCRADHGDDIIYMFGYMFDPEYKLPDGRYFSEDEKNLSKRMMKAWTDFARTGNPGWNSYDKKNKTMMVFNTPSDTIKSANDTEVQARLKIWREEYYGTGTKF